MSDYIRRDEAIEALRELERADIATYGVKIPEGFDATEAIKAIRELPGVEIEDAAKHEPKLETATIGGWDPVKRFDEIFRKKEGE